MLKRFLPNEQVKDVFEIKAEDLVERGIKAVITDLDNTLVEWDRPDATEEVVQWFKQMADYGIDVTVVSNNKEERLKIFCEPLGVPYFYRAWKPSTKVFEKALEQMNVEKEATVVIGDQLLTDILGGNNAGLYTILVIPVTQTDSVVTKFNRFVERKILNRLKKKGMIQWEE